jgi:phosphoglycerate kinase
VAKLSIRDLDLTGKRVFVRVDFNVPLKNGVITDDTRIRSSLPTIQYAIDHGASVVIVASHLGRPKGKPDPQFSLAPAAVRLAELLGCDVAFAADCIGDPAKQAIDRARKAAPSAAVVLLENLRFHPEEEKNDPAFANALAALADVYVDDAFGAAHRAHASVDGIVRHVPKAAAGLLMEKEIQYLGHVLEAPERPFVAILGGAKVSDKLEVIENLLGRVDTLLVGGAMAYTFLRAQNVATGKSLVEEDKLDAARDILAHAQQRQITFALPVDHLVTDRIDGTGSSAVLQIPDPAIGDRMGVDIGPKTLEAYRSHLAGARTVVWNGPMGVFEVDAFAKGTIGVAQAVANVTGTTVIGGGDSIAAVRKAGVADRITHISTGGGASLEFLGGRKLPGVEALTDK